MTPCRRDVIGTKMPIDGIDIHIDLYKKKYSAHTKTDYQWIDLVLLDRNISPPRPPFHVLTDTRSLTDRRDVDRGMHDVHILSLSIEIACGIYFLQCLY